MDRKIKRVKLFSNGTTEANKIANILQSKLINNGYVIDEDNFDLGVAIGGDGSFLHMVKNCDFNEDVYYIGVNAGTLGFAQDIYPTELDEFINRMNNNSFKIEEISTLETDIYSESGISKFHSLNEILLRDKNLKTTYLKVLINEELLENFVGDGILVSTSFGSSAYNLSFGGSIVYNELHTLQITPVGPSKNNVYPILRNSVIFPETRKITIIPEGRTENILMQIDGENNIYDNVEKIETSVKRKVKCLRMNEYDYTRKINEKFL